MKNNFSGRTQQGFSTAAKKYVAVFHKEVARVRLHFQPICLYDLPHVDRNAIIMHAEDSTLFELHQH